MSVLNGGSRFTIDHGTTIIVYRSTHSIWMAADSLATRIDNPGSVQGRFHTRKLEEFNDVVYAFYWNPRLSIDGEEVFDAYKVMQAALCTRKDFADSFVMFESLLTERLDLAVNAAAEKNAALMAGYTGVPYLGMVMATCVGGLPKIINACYRIVRKGKVLSTIRYSYSDQPVSLRLLGSASHIERFLRKNRMYLEGGEDMGKKLYRLIKLEAENSAAWVGLPCDVVQLYAGGSRWTQFQEK